jgi:heme exporter protein D
MNALSAWFDMGGYAAFVWSAYGIAALVLGGIAVNSWHRYRSSSETLARLQKQTGVRE